MRVVPILFLLAGCGRVNFGYPLVPCDEVVGNANALWPENEHCYTRHDVAVTFAGARGTCAALGGHVATITSGEEQDVIVGLSLAGPTWIGLTSGGAGSTTFTWMTSEPTPLGSWGPGEPMYCTMTTGTSALLDPTGGWTAACQNAGWPFACEIEPWLVRDDGHAYRVYWGAEDWLSAGNGCASFGAHLATITSEAERVFVSTLATNVLWIGGTVTVAGVMSWSTGESVSYTAWASGQPNEGIDACVSIGADQVWNDTNCATPLFALCERD